MSAQQTAAAALLLAVLCLTLPQASRAIDLSRLYGHLSAKRTGKSLSIKSIFILRIRDSVLRRKKTAFDLLFFLQRYFVGDEFSERKPKIGIRCNFVRYFSH